MPLGEQGRRFPQHPSRKPGFGGQLRRPRLTSLAARGGRQDCSRRVNKRQRGLNASLLGSVHSTARRTTDWCSGSETPGKSGSAQATGNRHDTVLSGTERAGILHDSFLLGGSQLLITQMDIFGFCWLLRLVSR